MGAASRCADDCACGNQDHGEVAGWSNPWLISVLDSRRGYRHRTDSICTFWVIDRMVL
jgi:hypothetical protein